MTCKHCNYQMDDKAAFCPNCGAPAAPAAAQQPAVHTQPPAYAQQPVYAQQPAPQKKKGKGCLIALIIALVLVAAAVIFVLSILGVFGPKSLGVSYTEADYTSAVSKMGLDITFEGMSGDELREYTEEIKESGEQLDFTDYDFTFSDYEQKTFTLTQEEATAFLNELAPAFYWYKDHQIRITDDGLIEASGTLRLKYALTNYLPGALDDAQVPDVLKNIVVLDTVNVYTRSDLSIRNNAVSERAESLKAGPVELTDIFSSSDLAYGEDVVADTIFDKVPGLEIYSLYVNSDNEIAVDALIPQTVEITKKR